MKQTIYIDVLVSVNIFINYFLLLSVAKILNLNFTRKKLIFAAFIGSLCSLVILLPPINGFLSLLIKLAMSASVIFFAFEFVSLKFFLKILFAFYGMNFLFGGIIFCLWYFVVPNGIFINNNAIYLNIPPLFLATATLLAYLSIRVVNKIAGTQELSSKSFYIIIKSEKKELKLKAKLDTGNALREPFSSLPVIVVNYKFAENIMPSCIKEYFTTPERNTPWEHPPDATEIKNIRVVPFNTISGNGLLPAFKPDYVSIHGIKKEAYIAICKQKIFNNEYQALIGPEFIE